MRILINVMVVMAIIVFSRGLYTISETPVFDNVAFEPYVDVDQAGFIPQIARKMSSTEVYVQRFKDVAVEEMKNYGIPASITLAQGILESGSGRSDLAMIDNNHFGIKCKPKCLNCLCRNYADDSPYDMFRVFKSAWESYREHSKLLVGAERYKFLFKLKKTDYKGWARGLQKAGYATSKTYSKSLISIIEKYKLQKFDKV
jgi:flagellum-specific peptidoglycan hydrolase FlgJ